MKGKPTVVVAVTLGFLAEGFRRHRDRIFRRPYR